MNGARSNASMSPRGAVERRAPEGVTEIAHDVPARGALERRLQRVDAVVRWLDVRILEQGLQHEQSLQRPRADEGVVVERPFGVGLQAVEVGILLTEPRRQLRVGRTRAARLPFREQVRRRLVVPEAPVQP
jgi:hypothetical protein